ncbi:SDR family NAD(P)-dependent oxidoreductase [Thermodesulfobacteriota bacterium]
MGNRLNGRVAVVTGSGQGIGKSIAIAMAEEGAKLITNNRRPGSTALKSYDKEFLKTLSTKEAERAARVVQDAETTADEIRDMGGEAIPFFGDISEFDIAGQLMRTALDHFGKIDILVNNAGAFHMSPVWEMSLEAWHKVVDSHLQGTFNCIRHTAGPMKQQGWGRIINAISGAWLGQTNGCNYSAAKGGVVGLTRAVARDMYPFGVTCNAFAPAAMTRSMASGIIHSRRVTASGGPGIPEEKLKMLENTPLPEAIAPFILYLATDEAAHISGSVFSLMGNHIGLYSEPSEVSTLDKQKGYWTVGELIEQIPKGLLNNYKSPAAQEQHGIPGQ